MQFLAKESQQFSLNSSREEHNAEKGKNINKEIDFCRVLTIKSCIIFSLLMWSFVSIGDTV